MEQGSVEELEAEQRQARTELLALAQENPSLLEDLERMEQVMDFVDANPDVIRDARSFVDTLDD